MTELLTADQVRDRLRKACEAAGGQSQWAKSEGVSVQYVNDVLRGRRDAGISIAEGLGLARVIFWQEAGTHIDGSQNVR